MSFLKPQQNESGRRQIGINLFSVCVAIPLLVALVVASVLLFRDLERIESLALTTSESHLPQVMAKQELLRRIEELRHKLTQLHNAPDPGTLESVGFSPDAPFPNAVLEAFPDLGQTFGPDSPRIGRLVKLKWTIFHLETALRRSEIELARLIGRISPHIGSQPGAPGPDFEDGLIGMTRTEESDYLKFTILLRPFVAYCATLPVDDPLAVDCNRMELNWQTITEVRNRLFPARREARLAWQEMDRRLATVSDAVSIVETEWIMRAMSLIGTQVRSIMHVFPLLGGLILVGLLLVLWLVHGLLLRPLTLMSRALRAIRSGRSLNRLPAACIRELQDIIDILPDISHYLRELHLRSNRLAVERDRYADLSSRDALTGVGNRRELDRVLESIPAGRAFALLMLDLDHFKDYNDTFGHQAGDAALKAVADILCGALRRTTDQVFRYGGEEFLILLPGADSARALLVGHRILHGLREADLSFPASSTGRLTVSIGIAERLCGEETPVPDVLARADRALYLAKDAGRDRAVVFGRDI